MTSVRLKFALERNPVSGKLTLNIYLRIFLQIFAIFANFVANFHYKILDSCFYIHFEIKQISRMSLPMHLSLSKCIQTLIYWFLPSLFMYYKIMFFARLPNFQNKLKILIVVRFGYFFCNRLRRNWRFIITYKQKSPKIEHIGQN